jgi:hypothetical protein
MYFIVSFFLWGKGKMKEFIGLKSYQKIPMEPFGITGLNL